MLSAFTEEFMSTPKIITILRNSPVGNEKALLISNPIPHPEYFY